MFLRFFGAMCAVVVGGYVAANFAASGYYFSAMCLTLLTTLLAYAGLAHE